MSIRTTFDDLEGVLLVDTSYLVYAIFHRCLNVYQSYFDDLPEDGEEQYKYDLSKDEEYIVLFVRNFVSKIKGLQKEYMIPTGNVIMALDCRKKDIWRQSYFDEYKAHRMVREESGFNPGPIFNYVINTLLPKLESRGMCKCIKHFQAEGDDIVAISKNFFREISDSMPIVICASDGDLVQLVDNHTYILDTRGNKIHEKTLGSRTIDLLYKILKGDTADGFGACFEKTAGDSVLSRGFGRVAVMKLINDKELRNEYFRKYPESIAIYKRNRILADLSRIPESIVEDVLGQLREEFI